MVIGLQAESGETVLQPECHDNLITYSVPAWCVLQSKGNLKGPVYVCMYVLQMDHSNHRTYLEERNSYLDMLMLKQQQHWWTCFLALCAIQWVLSNIAFNNIITSAFQCTSLTWLGCCVLVFFVNTALLPIKWVVQLHSDTGIIVNVKQPAEWKELISDVQLIQFTTLSDPRGS